MTDVGRLGVYEVSEASLEAIASGVPAPADLVQLKSVEKSMQRLLWRAVFERLSVMPHDSFGELDPPTCAWRLLTEAHERAPEAVETVMEDPFLRAWVVALLRRFDEPDSERDGGDGAFGGSRSPIWVDVAQFHATAAAAAIRAGLPAAITVATSAGRVWLPTLGVATCLDTDVWSVAQVRSLDSGVVVEGVERTVSVRNTGGVADPNWQPLLQATSGLRLDCVTPYRDFGYQLRSVAEMQEEATEWRSRLAVAEDLLAAWLPGDRAVVAAMVSTIVPLSPPVLDPLSVASASSPDAFGAVGMSLPPDAAHTAASLIHEARHQQLNALLLLTPLVEERDVLGRDDDAVHYAPWRSDPRPALGLCHGVAAFAGVAGFWRVQRREAVEKRDALRAHFEFAVLRQQVHEGATGLLASGRLTDPGEIFARALLRTIESWLPEPVPETPARLARDVCEARRSTWRLRHLRLDTADARALAEGWRSRRATSTEVRAVPHPRPELVRPDARGALSRLYVSCPEAFTEERLRAHGEIAVQMDLIAGDRSGAERWYRERISERPDHSEFWVGWAAAWAQDERPPSARLLMERPEVAKNVYECLAADGEIIDPLALSEWLADVVLSHEGGVDT
ncbi:HEXXH motif-containing putative peptide modification protein [Streptomyces chartreusis]|uniref:aKG-HExxH-type peptide beta-hydroxylase n=1 Tax=Streptomyces chartreusis TaxID=1969 RepID=UPI0034180482